MSVDFETLSDGTAYVFERDGAGHPRSDTCIVWDGPVMQL